MNERNQRIQNLRILTLIPIGIALNLGLGTLVSTLKVPLYLDAIATIAVTLLAGWRAGVAVGVGSFLIGGLLVNPVLPWFSGTQAVVAVFTSWVASKGWLRTAKKLSLDGDPSSKRKPWFNCLRVILIGVSLGIIAGLASAPIIVWLFSGITGSGPSVIVAVLLKSGETLFKSVLLSGFASEPIDKTLQLIIALVLIRSLPNKLKEGFGGPHLEKNGLLSC